MISVWGRTYRIECVSPGTYDAVRLLDDARVGSFGDGARFCLNSLIGGEALLREIAQTAIRGAKTRWTMRAAE
jgi:hypothetical protein